MIKIHFQHHICDEVTSYLKHDCSFPSNMHFKFVNWVWYILF
jgi:hypothetical protein